MFVIDYKNSHHQQIIRSCIMALKAGKVVAYPTDTSYGLAVDATNAKAIKKLYKIKGRNFNKPIHVIVPSVAYGKRIVKWNQVTSKLAKKFWPGPLTFVLPNVGNGLDRSLHYRILSAGSGFLGIRMPNNKIALDLAKRLRKPITTTSANISGKNDCYSADDVVAQFRSKKNKLDVIINTGKLPKRKPSTVVKIEKDSIQILRPGPVSKKNILKYV